MKANYIIILAVLTIMSSCKKDQKVMLDTDVRIINTAIGTSIKVDVGRGISYSKLTPIASGGNRTYLLERSAIPFKIVSSTDTTLKIYENELRFSSGYYSLFIVGQSANIEIILKEELDLPFINFTDIITNKLDSVVNVRFINLSPNSVPLKVKLAAVTGNEVDNLPYKGFGSWRKYTAAAASTVYAFQLRDATTDALITTFNFTANATNRFKNVSLIVKGLQGTTTGVNAFGVMTVNHF